MEVLHSCMLPFEKSLKLKIGFSSVKEDHFNIHIITVLMEEILEED